MASKFTVEATGRLIAHVRGGLFRQNAAELCGISARTLSGWTGKGRDQLEQAERSKQDGKPYKLGPYARFLLELLAAEAEAESKLIGVVYKIATNAKADDRDRIAAATWYLERKNNLRYGRGALRVDIGKPDEDDVEDVVETVLERLTAVEKRVSGDGGETTH